MTINSLCMQEMMKNHVEIMHTRQWQSYNITLYSLIVLCTVKDHITIQQSKSSSTCIHMWFMLSLSDLVILNLAEIAYVFWNACMHNACLMSYVGMTECNITSSGRIRTHGT